MSVFEKLKQYRELFKQKLELEAQLKPITKALGVLEFQAIEDMQKQGAKSLNVDGVTFARRTEFYARAKKGIPREKLMSVLATYGMSELLQLSPQTVRAKMKEAANAGQTLPHELLDVLDCGTHERLSVNGLKAAIAADYEEPENNF